MLTAKTAPGESAHVKLEGGLSVARHYLPDLVYGANDGIITTFAVVAGVAGGALSPAVILIIGVANLFGDGFSMAAGNYQAIRSRESVLRTQGLPGEESQPVRHAFATFAAFVVAGAIPLLPFLLSGGTNRLAVTVVMTLVALMTVGVLRAAVTDGRWWRDGLEMCGLGVVVAAVAYASGALIARVLTGMPALQ
jgi:VIT1/CCC1 family predicted Fe2+/Mn2+ transporter